MYLQKKSTMIIFSELQNMNEEDYIYKKKIQKLTRLKNYSVDLFIK